MKKHLIWMIPLFVSLVAFLPAACQAPAQETAVPQDTTTAEATTTPGETTAQTQETTASEATTASAGYRQISPEDARDMLSQDKTVVLLDVRTLEEYAEGHIPGSLLLPYDEIAGRASDLPDDKSTPIIVYCRTGRRSAIAAQTLLDLGYSEVYDLGGIQSWPYETVK